MNRVGKEYHYKKILFKNVPIEVDLREKSNVYRMDRLNLYYEVYPDVLKNLFSTETINNEEILVIPQWSINLLDGIQNSIRNNTLIIGNLLFTRVKYEYTSGKRQVEQMCSKHIADIQEAYRYSPEEFKQCFPLKNIDGQDYLVVPCMNIRDIKSEIIISINKNKKFIDQVVGNLFFCNVINSDIENEKQRMSEIHNYLRRYSFEEIEERYVNGIENSILKVINKGNRKHIEIPNTVRLDYFKQYNAFEKLNNREDENFTEIITNYASVSHTSSRARYLEQDVKTNNPTFNQTNGATKLPEPNISREPIGSMRPRKNENSIEYNVEKSKSLKLGNDNPDKVNREIKTTVRDQQLVVQIKELYKYTCQICGVKVETGFNEFTTEVHHIQPLGGQHNGPDIKENMIVLCSNDHVMFDNGAITIDLSNLTVKHVNPANPIHNAKIVLKHKIDEKYINYHNKNIFIKY